MVVKPMLVRWHRALSITFSCPFWIEMTSSRPFQCCHVKADQPKGISPPAGPTWMPQYQTKVVHWRATSYGAPG